MPLTLDRIECNSDIISSKIPFGWNPAMIFFVAIATCYGPFDSTEISLIEIRWAALRLNQSFWLFPHTCLNGANTLTSKGCKA